MRKPVFSHGKVTLSPDAGLNNKYIFVLLRILYIISEISLWNTVMKQSIGLKGDLKSEHKKNNMRSTIAYTILPLSMMLSWSNTILSGKYKCGFPWNATIKKAVITKTHLFKYIETFTTKNWKFSDKNSDIFYISVQSINCGYSLEPPRCQSMFLSKNKKK